MKDIVLGIDLGTTNSLAAYMTASGPVVVRDADGTALIPSVIAFSPDGTVTVGAEARAHAVEHPLSTVYSIKRLMGKGLADVQADRKFLPYPIVEGPHDTVRVQVGPMLLAPQELSAMILRDVKARTEAALGQTITKAVITTPAYFDDAQRQATRDAARIAGLDVLRIVNEPTAAALAYGLGRKQDQTLAVYDLGGGTFDISILRVSDGIFQVLSTNGDTHLGGDDIDRALIELIASEIRQQFGEELTFPPATRQGLRNFAEATKIRLSEQTTATIQVELGRDKTYRRTITRQELEARAEPWIQHTLAHCQTALKDADLTAQDIDEVVLVGGTTRMGLVRRMVEAFFGRQPYTALDPEEVVAMGAAVQAGILAGIQPETLLLDVTPLSLGIETLGGAVGKLIMRNSTIPCQASENFTTYVDGQTSVDINILQGERELAKDCRLLGQFKLAGIPPMPAGAPRIEVIFLIDANGILNVAAREQRSGKAASVQITPSHGLTAEEVERMVKESYAHAIEDLTTHRVIDLRNEATRILKAIEKARAEAPNALSDEQAHELDAAVAYLEIAMQGDEPDTLYAAMQTANESAMPLTEAQMDEVLRKTVKGRKIDEV